MACSRDIGWLATCSGCARIVRDFKPDVVHVHGTERFFGLLRARKLIDVPTVVSIQGLMRPFADCSWGAMTFWDSLRLSSVGEMSRNATIGADVQRLKRLAEAEDEIIQGVDAVIGRTDWDHAHARAANPKVNYFHINEMLRPEFGAAEPWSAWVA